MKHAKDGPGPVVLGGVLRLILGYVKKFWVPKFVASVLTTDKVKKMLRNL